MKIVVIGTGGVGGFFGAQLAVAGHEVILVSRGHSMENLIKSGLLLETPGQDLNLNYGIDYEVHDSSDPSRRDLDVDLVIICVKSYSMGGMYEILERYVQCNTMVMTLQNGLLPSGGIDTVVNPRNLLQGMAYVEVSQVSAGHYVQEGDVAKIIYGCTHPSPNPKISDLNNLFQNSPVGFTRATDIHEEVWKKFMFIATVAGVTTSARERLSVLFEDAEWVSTTKAVLEEIVMLATCSGITTAFEIGAESWKFIMDNSNDIVASMHTDLNAGRPLELEALTGSICGLGASLGVNVPLNKLIYGSLKEFKEGRI